MIKILKVTIPHSITYAYTVSQKFFGQMAEGQLAWRQLKTRTSIKDRMKLKIKGCYCSENSLNQEGNTLEDI